MYEEEYLNDDVLEAVQQIEWSVIDTEPVLDDNYDDYAWPKPPALCYQGTAASILVCPMHGYTHVPRVVNHIERMV